MYVLQVYYLKVYQSLTNFYLNITSFSKGIKFVTPKQMVCRENEYGGREYVCLSVVLPRAQPKLMLTSSPLGSRTSSHVNHLHAHASLVYTLALVASPLRPFAHEDSSTASDVSMSFWNSLSAVVAAYTMGGGIPPDAPQSAATEHWLCPSGGHGEWGTPSCCPYAHGGWHPGFNPWCGSSSPPF